MLLFQNSESEKRKGTVRVCQKKPLIAFYLPSLRGGGAERITVKLVKSFLLKGYPVDLVLASAEGPYLSDVPEHCRVVDLKSKRVVKSLPRLLRYLHRERPEALVSGLNHTNVIALAASVLAMVPVKVVTVEHNTFSVDMANPRYFRARLLPLLMRLLYPRAGAIVAVSRGVADDMISVFPSVRDKVRVIYNPVIGPELFELADAPIEHGWFAKGSSPVVLSVGRLTEQKDYPTLMRAFALVRDVMDCRLVILGEGEERGLLESLAAELGIAGDIWMPGFVENPYRFMKRAAVYVLSSRWEGLPTVLIEAMACGTPLVSTDCPSGPREILQDGRCGKLVPVGGVTELAGAIQETLVSGKRELSGQEWKRFEIESAAQAYEKLVTGG